MIVDRTLDLASVVGHFHDTLLDKMTAVLPRLPRHHVDVMVDMTPLSTVTRSAVTSLQLCSLSVHCSLHRFSIYVATICSSCCCFPSPHIDNIRTVVIIWRIRTKISELFTAVLCIIIVQSYSHTNTREQFIQVFRFRIWLEFLY